MKPYIKILIKQNLAYFIILAVMIVGTFFSIGYLYNLNTSLNGQITQAESEILSLGKRQKILQSLASNNAEQISNDLEIMNSLIPNSEDYFSIIYALDQLSQKTGFTINSYTVDLAESKENKLALSVTGVGDSQSFLQFLRDYNTGGGRLITAETIQLDSTNSSSIKLQLNFYNKTASAEDVVENPDYEAAFKNFEKIRSKVSIALTEEQTSESETKTDYTPKSNPF